MESENFTDLTGKLLIAMPSMGDKRFESAVVFLCAHSSDGSMGLIVNKLHSDVLLTDMLDQLQIPKGDTVQFPPVHRGGPVETGRGFVLHSADYEGEAGSMQVNEGFGMTATRDILLDIAAGDGPDEALICLGYAGWGPGQLETELAANAWLTCDASERIVFQVPDHLKWDSALKSMGIAPALLSGDTGHA